jgi:hypothetical protein
VVGIVMYMISGKWEEEHRFVCLLQKWKARGRRNMGMVSGR